MRTVTIRLPLVLIMLAATSPAYAKPAASAQAEALFDDAKKLMSQKRYAEACDKFDSSQKLDPAVTTLINAADCREKNNQLATAWGLFVDVERETRGNDVMAKLHSIAQERAHKLEGRLSHLTIKVDPATSKIAGFAVTIGNDPVLAGSFGTALPMDGGTYTITASAPQRETFTQTLELAAQNDTKTVEIPALAPKGAATSVRPRLPPEGPEHPAGTGARSDAEASDTDHPPAPGRSHKGALIATAGAIVLAGGAVGLELWGRSLLDDAKHEVFHDKQSALYDDANDRHFLAQGLGIAAVAATGVAVYFWLRGGKRASSDAAILVPSVGPEHAGLALCGSWR